MGTRILGITVYFVVVRGNYKTWNYSLFCGCTWELEYLELQFILWLYVLTWELEYLELQFILCLYVETRILGITVYFVVVRGNYKTWNYCLFCGCTWKLEYLELQFILWLYVETRILGITVYFVVVRGN